MSHGYPQKFEARLPWFKKCYFDLLVASNSTVDKFVRKITEKAKWNMDNLIKKTNHLLCICSASCMYKQKVRWGPSNYKH
jgi:hypothetical protein